MKKKHIILDAMDWLMNMEAKLPAVPVKELPDGDGAEFWSAAVRMEMGLRSVVSAKTRRMIAAPEAPPSMTPAECWLYRKRAEWAGQLFLAKAAEHVRIPDSVTLPALLEWALIETWDSDGCIAMWNHGIERGGKPPQENPEYLKGVDFG